MVKLIRAIAVSLLFSCSSSWAMETSDTGFKWKITEVIGEDDNFFLRTFSGNYQSPDGSKLLMCSSSGILTIVDLTTHNSVKVRVYENEPIKYAQFSPSGQMIITTSGKGNVKILNIEGKQLARFQDDDDSIHLAVFGDSDYAVFTNSIKNINKAWGVSSKL